ncbi:Crp/Fnr family transcriptional regulator [Chitinophaga sp. 22620]|uniref:Crp/Fnr family transcriptional regulator n=1 Tax=Chitinophaga sp. 22620 TaxID=3453952 RepID=UPI003F84B5F7
MYKPQRGLQAPSFPFTDHTTASHFTALFTELQKHNPLLSQREIDEIIPCCKVVTFKKNDLLLDYGEICRCRHVYFAAEGLVTALYIKDGKENNCWFMAEGEVIIAIDSFYNQARSEEKLQALENTTCIVLYIEDLTALTRRLPEFLWVENMLTRHYYQQAFARTKWVHYTAAERYALLIENYPKFNDRVSNSVLASYLGISPVHLNRIKRNCLSKKVTNVTLF